MSQTDKSQQLLNWLNKEKKKDEIELETSKKVFVNDIRNFNKEEFFKNKKQTKSLWRKIRMMIWGY